MENETLVQQPVQQPQTTTPPTDPMVALVSTILGAVRTHITQLIDERLADTMRIHAVSALFDDALDAKIRGIAREEAVDVYDDNERDLETKVTDIVNELDIDEKVERTFVRNVNWEDHVDEKVRELVDDLVDDDAIHDKVVSAVQNLTFNVSVE